MRRPATRVPLMAGGLAGALAGTLLLSGCGGSASGTPAHDGRPELSVSSAYMPRPVSDSMAAGFLTITNKGGAEDRLTSVTSADAKKVTVHETTGGAMREAGSLTVPAHGRLVLESGGNHLMFDGLTHRPEQGGTISVVLHFAESGSLSVEMPVKPATYHPATGH